MKEKKKKRLEKEKSEEKQLKKAKKSKKEEGKKKKKKAAGNTEAAKTESLQEIQEERAKNRRVIETENARTPQAARIEKSDDPAFSPAAIFRALGDEQRLRILELLREKELCAAEILQSLSIVQSTLSHHMKSLCESGVVCARKQGKWTYYSINGQTVRMAQKYLECCRNER